MNVTLDDAEEVRCSDKARKPLGRLLLKGDNIVRANADETLIQPAL